MYKPMCWWMVELISPLSCPWGQGLHTKAHHLGKHYFQIDINFMIYLPHQCCPIYLARKKIKTFIALNLQGDFRHLAAGRYISGWRWTLPRWGDRGWSPATFISQGSGSELKAVEGSPAISWKGAQALSSVDLWDLYFRVIFVKHNIMYPQTWYLSKRLH